MKYSIQHETKHSIRLKLGKQQLPMEEAEKLSYALHQSECVQKVTVYSATAGVRIEYSGERDQLLAFLEQLSYEDIELPASDHITAEELRSRKLAPDQKKKMRNEIIVESLADSFLPMPFQIGYHVYQLARLKNL